MATELSHIEQLNAEFRACCLKSIAESVRQNSESLRCVGRLDSERCHTLSSLERNVKSDDEHATNIAEALVGTNNTNLVQLHFCNDPRRVGNAGAEALARSLKYSALRHLNLANNQVGGQGVGALGDALAGNMHLESLQLQNQVKTPRARSADRDYRPGIERIANGLARNMVLRELCLDQLKLDNHSAVALARALMEYNDSLRVLHLRSNRIELPGCKALAEMLKHNDGLEELSLDSNPMGDSCVCAIAQSLPSNHRLRCLSLLNMSCGTKVFSALRKALQENTHLAALPLSFERNEGDTLTATQMTTELRSLMTHDARQRKLLRWLFRGFLVGLHPIAGANSPVRWLPLQAVEHIHSQDWVHPSLH